MMDIARKRPAKGLLKKRSPDAECLAGSRGQVHQKLPPTMLVAGMQQKVSDTDIPILAIKWLIKTAKSKWKRGIPKTCPECNAEKPILDIEAGFPVMYCLKCGHQESFTPPASVINIIVVEKWLEKIKS